MLLLTIDTCTDLSTLGLVRDGVVLAEAAFPSRHTLARRILPRIEWLLAECGLTKHDVEGIALSLGPGSFTGVRLGAAVAKTLAVGLHVPLVGLSTLDAIIFPFRSLEHTLLVPVINARRQQVYTACFHREGETLVRASADQALSAEAFAGELDRHRGDRPQILVAGYLEGIAPAFFQHAPVPLACVRALVTPHALAALAEARLARGEADDAMTLAPIYLRPVAD